MIRKMFWAWIGFLVLSIAFIGGIVAGEILKIPALPSLSGILLTYSLQEFFIKTIDLFFDRKNWQKDERKFKRVHEIDKNKPIRISFAYLFRIIVDGKYLLIKNSRNTGKFQPIGGVYKYNDDEKKFLKKSFLIEYDDKIKNDKTSKNDYRFYIKEKFLRKFVKHFIQNTDNRENEKDVSREFKEEVLSHELLKKRKFGKMSYHFDCRFIEFSYSQYFQCYELVLSDIYEIELDDKQSALLKIVIENDSENFITVTKKDIDSFGINLLPNENKDIISNHSWKIVRENQDRASDVFTEDNTFEKNL